MPILRMQLEILAFLTWVPFIELPGRSLIISLPNILYAPVLRISILGGKHTLASITQCTPFKHMKNILFNKCGEQVWYKEETTEWGQQKMSAELVKVWTLAYRKWPTVESVNKSWHGLKGYQLHQKKRGKSSCHIHNKSL